VGGCAECNSQEVHINFDACIFRVLDPMTAGLLVKDDG
jgi:phenylacetate-coenzyme A ligase PaaK-like adenylate-forming protein